MSSIPSLLNLQNLQRRFRVFRLNIWQCQQCYKGLGKERYLKDHINTVHVKTILCDFCDYKVSRRRRKQREAHMLRRHQFPAPIPSNVNVVSPSTSSFLAVPSTQETVTIPDLRTPETDQIVLKIGDPSRTMNSDVTTSMDYALESSDISFDAVFPTIYLTQSRSLSSATGASTPCLDEHSPPAFSLFSDLDLEPSDPFSSSRPDLPPLQDLI